MKKISDFTPQKRNANKHTPYGLRLLEKSLREDGFIDAQTAAADGEIISGSARLEKAVEVFTDEDGQEVEPIIVHSDGKRPVIVIRDDIPNAEHPRARRLSVAANKIAQVDFDPDWALLKEWGGEDEQIKKLFSDDEWREGTGDEAPQVDAEPQIDRAAELQEKWQTASGQLWQLGKHRLLIGDCTVRENVERLMGGERAVVMFSDPPYRMETQGGGALHEQYSKTAERIKDIVDFKPSAFLSTLQMYFEKDYHSTFLFCNKDLILEYLIYAKENKLSANILVWHKPVVVPFGDSHRPDIEYIVFFRHRAKWVNGLSDANYSRCLEYPNQRDEMHPTVKPLELVKNQLRITSEGDDIVVDPFGGSGTTIIAAQNLSRRCFACEISEKYGAVILERFASAFPAEEIRQVTNG